jgi:membrane-associated phospholipid phosphatase
MAFRWVQVAMLRRQLKTTGKVLLEADDQTQQLFKPYIGSPIVRALGVLSKIADQPELRFISGSLIAAGTIGGSDRLARAGARMMIAHEAATLAKRLIKTNVDRTRPRSATERAEKKPKKGKHKAKELSSFPSGHSAGAIAAARAFAREYPEYGAAALGAATVVALIQVPRCAHYPTDVAAGLAIGLVAEAAVDAAWDALELDGRSPVTNNGRHLELP